MNKISCFLPYAGKEQVEKTVNSLQATGLIEEIRLITTDATLESLPDCEILFVDMPYSSATLKAIANAAKGEYTLLYTKETTLEMGMFALERMIHILEDSSAGMVYADHYQIADGKQSNAPVIDYQFGSLRDDFNFGSLLLFNTEKLKEAAGHMKSDYNFAGLYDLRLKLSQHSDLVHINEYLYSEVENDTRKSGEKIFDYVDPKNRDRQIEMEQACTEHLKEIGGYLAPEFPRTQRPRYRRLLECRCTPPQVWQVCRAAGQRRRIQRRKHTRHHGTRLLRTELRHGGRHLYDDGLQHEHDCSGHHRPQGMDSGKRTQQRPPHQRSGCPARLLYPGAARSESTQYQLWRRLCTGTELLPPIPDRTCVRRGLPLPPLGRQLRCLTGHRENERTQPLQRPHPYLGTSGTHSDEQKQVI